jgi:Probable sensor domain DACNK
VAISARLRRLTEELAEAGLELDGTTAWGEAMLEELDYALRPPVHERRVSSVGAIIEPTTEPAVWEQETTLTITRRPVGEVPLASARLFADGLSSWVIRPVAGAIEWAIFDRPAGSERDLVVLAGAMGATLVQRHPAGSVRIVGSFGVLRWDGRSWHHERPISSWLDAFSAFTCPAPGDSRVFEHLLEFAVHDLGARGIGALLVYRADDTEPAPRHHSRSPGRRTSPRCATCWRRWMGPPCSTAGARCASWACAWCRAPTPKPRSSRCAARATPPGGATATATTPPPSSW